MEKNLKKLIDTICFKRHLTKVELAKTLDISLGGLYQKMHNGGLKHREIVKLSETYQIPLSEFFYV